MTTGLRFHKWGCYGGIHAWQAWVRLLYPTVYFDTVDDNTTRAWQDGRKLFSVGTYRNFNNSSATIAPVNAKEPY
jgi:hypothetical protein